MTLIMTYRLVGIIRFRFYCRTIHPGATRNLYKKRYQGLACLFCDTHSLNDFKNTMDELGITVTYC